MQETCNIIEMSLFCWRGPASAMRKKTPILEAFAQYHLRVRGKKSGKLPHSIGV